MLDEFPLLGRMPFFETMMGGMAGYGLKAFLVCQSLNHVTKAYGRDNVILDNCHLVTAFAAADGDTAKRIADMAGEVWELRESETRKRPQPILGFREGSTTIREERRPLLLPADVRSLPRDEQLIFVSGVKPIRAKKIRFDQEEVFRARLAPSARKPVQLSVVHDWSNVVSLGTIPQAAVKKSKPAMTRPIAAQPDLFAKQVREPARDGQSISEQALAGFRTAQNQSAASSDGASIAVETANAGGAASSSGAPNQAERPRRRAKGI